MAKKIKESKITFMPKSPLQKKANLIFTEIAGIALICGAVVLWFIIKSYSGLVMFLKPWQMKLNEVCGCANHISFANHPLTFVSLILVGALAAVFFAAIILKIIKFKNSTRRFIKASLRNRQHLISPKLRRASGHLKAADKIIEIKAEPPVVFCFGLIKPRICISSGMVARLSEKELKSVLKHEQHHLLSHEPAKLFIVNTAAKALFFIPGLKLLVRQYLALSELTADEQATNYFKEKLPLCGALYKVIKWKEAVAANNNLALSFFSTITKERINKLTDSDYAPKFELYSLRLAASVLLIIFSPFLFNLSLSHAAIDNSDGYNACPLMQPAENHQCEIPDAAATCMDGYSAAAKLCAD